MKQRLTENGVYLDDDDDDAIELIDEDEIVVILDDHQNKHQRSKIQEIKQYTGQPGSKFARGKDLDWHTANTAEIVKATVQEAVSKGTATKDANYSPSKDPKDGIIYDLTISFDPDTGKWVGSYHCNPVDDEPWAIDGGDAEEES